MTSWLPNRAIRLHKRRLAGDPWLEKVFIFFASNFKTTKMFRIGPKSRRCFGAISGGCR